MTLRRRLTLMSVVAVAVTVLCAAVASYAALRSQLRGQADDALRRQGALVGEPASGGPRRGRPTGRAWRARPAPGDRAPARPAPRHPTDRAALAARPAPAARRRGGVRPVPRSHGPAAGTQHHLGAAAGRQHRARGRRRPAGQRAGRCARGRLARARLHATRAGRGGDPARALARRRRPRALAHALDPARDLRRGDRGSAGGESRPDPTRRRADPVRHRGGRAHRGDRRPRPPRPRRRRRRGRPHGGAVQRDARPAGGHAAGADGVDRGAAPARRGRVTRAAHSGDEPAHERRGAARRDGAGREGAPPDPLRRRRPDRGAVVPRR